MNLKFDSATWFKKNNKSMRYVYALALILTFLFGSALLLAAEAQSTSTIRDQTTLAVSASVSIQHEIDNQTPLFCAAMKNGTKPEAQAQCLARERLLRLSRQGQKIAQMLLRMESSKHKPTSAPEYNAGRTKGGTPVSYTLDPKGPVDPSLWAPRAPCTTADKHTLYLCEQFAGLAGVYDQPYWTTGVEGAAQEILATLKTMGIKAPVSTPPSDPPDPPETLGMK